MPQPAEPNPVIIEEGVAFDLPNSPRASRGKRSTVPHSLERGDP